MKHQVLRDPLPIDGAIDEGRRNTLRYCALRSLANDGLAWLSRDNPRRFGTEFSEIRFNYENDNTPIPLRSKLFGLYPLTIAIMWLAMAVTLTR